MDFTYNTVAVHPPAARSPAARGAAVSRTILRLIFLLSSGGFLLQVAHADLYGFSSSNYVPRVRPDFDTADIPCDLSRPEGACALPGKAYPWQAINGYIEDNKAMLKRMYGETCDRPGQHARLRAQGPLRQSRGKDGDKADVGFVNACPSEQFVVTPFWANNSAGTTLAVVNFHPFEQAVQQEVCKPGTTGRCRDGCRCEQKYSWYRLLAFDPRNECRGIFMDWFQFPSCCACHCYEVDPSTKAEPHADLPLPKMGPLTSPAPTTPPTNATVDTDSDYDNDTTEVTVSPTTHATTTPPTSPTTKVTTVTSNLTTTALTTPSPSSPAPTPSHATGYLKFPYTAYNRTDYISLAKSHPANATHLKHRSATLSKAPPTTALPLAATDPGAVTTAATTTTEGADNTIDTWKAGDPARRKNRIPRI